MNSSNLVTPVSFGPMFKTKFKTTTVEKAKIARQQGSSQEKARKS